MIIDDVRFGWRQLLKAPGFTITAVLSLTLGIGANTAIFSLIDALLLRSLPVRDPQQLVQLIIAGRTRSEALRLLVVGLGLGLAAAWGVSRLVGSMLLV